MNAHRIFFAPKEEPLARETDDETALSWAHKRFFSSLVFATVATALCPLGVYEHGRR